MKQKKTIYFIILLQLFSFKALLADNNADKVSISGYVKDSKTGEDLIGVTVYEKASNVAVSTNAYGFYSITTTKGKHVFSFKYLGYQLYDLEVDLQSNTTKNINMEVVGKKLNEIQVNSKKKDQNIQTVQMSTNTISMEQLKKSPALFGEVDLIKNIQQLPGIQSAGEGTSAFFVRGGSSDQNLILLDEAPVYNPSHLVGIFSVFNADAIKSAEVYKGAIPAQFGGRLSSVVDIRSRDGNLKKRAGSASIGLLSAKATFEGPIKKDVGSYIISGRRTYFDLFLMGSSDKDVSSTKLYFYDVNAKINFKLGDKDRLFVAGYFGKDVFGSSGFGLNWGNATGTVRWNHVFNNRLFSNTTGIFSDFNYGLGVNSGVQGFDWKANITEYSIKQDFSYALNNKNDLKFGGQISSRTFQPGEVKPNDKNSIFKDLIVPKNYSLEYGLYASNEQKATSRISLQYGLRLSAFQNNGATIYTYANNAKKDVKEITDTINNGFFDVDKTFMGLEPRFGMRYMLNTTSSIKASYSRTYQYMHMLSNSTAPLPITMWVPSSRYVDPQSADQVGLGYFKNLFDDKVEVSVEGYYKWMNNAIDFKDNAQLLLNPAIETDILRGKGWSYGLEFYAKKSVGKTQGSISYTWSVTELQIDGINNGKAYYAPWDRRHNINIGVTHELNERWSFGANWTYGSGRPVTLPAAKYYFDYGSAVYYSERNGERTPDFHRLDISANLKSKKKEGRKWEGMWNFSIYNVYNRQNPFSVYSQNVKIDDDKTSNDKQIVMSWLFPLIPSVTYNITF
ncbi:MAG: TonB-dependent receptor [Bacteroidota bacterium]